MKEVNSWNCTNYQEQSECKLFWSVFKTIDTGIIINFLKAKQFCEKVK